MCFVADPQLIAVDVRRQWLAEYAIREITQVGGRERSAHDRSRLAIECRYACEIRCCDTHRHILADEEEQRRHELRGILVDSPDDRSDIRLTPLADECVGL